MLQQRRKELEGKLPEGRWSLSALNFPSSCYFHKIFGMHLQKGLVYLYTRKFLPLLLHFWNYNLWINGFPCLHSSMPPNTKSNCPDVFCEEGVLINFAKFTGKNLCEGLFFNKAALEALTKKETLAQVFSCEFCEISKSTFFYRTTLVIAPETRPLRAEWYKVLKIMHCGICPTG